MEGWKWCRLYMTPPPFDSDIDFLLLLTEGSSFGIFDNGTLNKWSATADLDGEFSFLLMGLIDGFAFMAVVVKVAGMVISGISDSLQGGGDILLEQVEKSNNSVQKLHQRRTLTVQ